MSKMRLVLSDREFNVLEYLDNEYLRLKWSYSRIGGCATCNFNLPRKLEEDRNIAGDFNIKIYVRNDSTQAYDLWYQGFISQKGRDIRKRERMPISVSGYAEQLTRIYVDRDYSSQEVSVIVKHLLDNEVTSNTDISYSSGDIEATGFTANDLEFNGTVKEAMQTLADLVNFEWGVDKDRKFYFKEKSTTVGHRYPLGRKCERFYSDDVSREIINRVIIKGGDVSESPFTATYNDLDSQRKWGRRDIVIHNTAIVTSEVAEQYADVILAERAGVVRRGYAKIVEVDERIEANLPIQLFHLIEKGVTYGEVNYGVRSYSGHVYYSIGHISYSMRKGGSIEANIEIGRPKETPGDTIAQIEHKLEQLRSQGM